MLNEHSLRAADGSGFGQQFIRPLYESYSFARIPGTVLNLFGGSGLPALPGDTLGPLAGEYDAVILLFLDAFGWSTFQQTADTAPFLRRVLDHGVVSRLTSQFPSTTAAHVTTIHSGLPVGESGVFEWNYYEPQLDAMISPLLFSFSGDRARDTLAATRIDPRRLYPTQTLYHMLEPLGVQSYIFQHGDYAFSPYTRVVTDGAQIVPYKTLAEALVMLGERRAALDGKAYYFLYYDGFDGVCHWHGPASAHAEAEREMLLTALERVLHPALERTPGRTLLLVAADHGQVGINPATTIYLNRDLPDVARLFRTNANDKLLVPGGSSRDMFLYVRDELLDEAEQTFRQLLAGHGEVYRTQELIAQGVFGTTEPSTEFLGRVGNLVLLPYAGESVWWYERGRFEQRFRGSHGGLTPEELETPLLAYAYG